MSIAGTIAKNTTFSFVNSIVELGIAFVTGIVLARGLGTEQYGLYAYVIWLISLAAIINNLGLGEMSRRFIPEAIGRRQRVNPNYIMLTMQPHHTPYAVSINWVAVIRRAMHLILMAYRGEQGIRYLDSFDLHQLDSFKFLIRQIQRFRIKRMIQAQ